MVCPSYVPLCGPLLLSTSWESADPDHSRVAEDFDRALAAIHTTFKALYDRKGENVEDDGVLEDAREVKEDRRDADGEESRKEELRRPQGITDSDWALYRVIDVLHTDFNAAFRAIFA